MLQLVHVTNRMPDRAAEMVESLDHEGVSGADLVQKLIEFGSGFECAGGGVGEDSITASSGQRIVLELCVLGSGGDSGVPKEVSHGS